MTKVLDRLHRALRTQKHDEAALHTHEHALHRDQSALAHEHDRFARDGKALKRQQAVLGHVRTTEQSRLAPLQQQRDALQARYDATVDPATGQGDPALQQALAGVNQQIADVHAQLDPTRLADRAKVDGLRSQKQGLRLAMQQEKRKIDGDQRSLRGDHAALAKDARAVAAARPIGVGGQVGQWIAQAQAVLAAHGVPYSKMNAKDIALIIEHESSGDPNAINNWDSNAAAGHPSEGLMQTIGPTFDAYKLKGHGRILNPVDNIIAGVRYAIDRYGSISNVPGVVSVHNGGAYVGY